MKNAEASLLLGRNSNFLASMKCSSREQYNHIESLPGNNILEKYTKYLNDQSEVKNELSKHFYWLEDNKLIFEFSRLLTKHNIMKNERCFSTSASNVIFNLSDGFKTYASYKKYKKILKILIKFRERKENEILSRNDTKKSI